MKIFCCKIFGVLFMVASTFIAVKAIEEVKENKELDPNYVTEVATDCQNKLSNIKRALYYL